MAPSQFARELSIQHPHQMPNMRPYHPENRGESPRAPSRLQYQSAAGPVDAGRQENERRVNSPVVTSSDAAKVVGDAAIDKLDTAVEVSKYPSFGKISQTYVKKQRRNVSKPRLSAPKQPASTTIIPNIPSRSSPSTPKLPLQAGKRFLDSTSPPKEKFSHIPEYLQPNPPRLRRPVEETRRIRDKHVLLSKFGHLTQKHFQIPAHEEIKRGRSVIKNLYVDKQILQDVDHEAGLNHNLNSGQDHLSREALHDRKMLGLGIIIVAIVVLILVRVTGAEPVVRTWCGSLKQRLNRAGWKGDFKMGLRNTYWARRTRKTRSANVIAGGGFELAAKHNVAGLFWVNKSSKQHEYQMESGCGGLGA